MDANGTHVLSDVGFRLELGSPDLSDRHCDVPTRGVQCIAADTRIGDGVPAPPGGTTRAGSAGSNLHGPLFWNYGLGTR